MFLFSFFFLHCFLIQTGRAGSRCKSIASSELKLNERIETVSTDSTKVTKLSNRWKMLQNFLVNVPEIPKFAEFPNCEPWNPKFGIFREESQVKDKSQCEMFRNLVRLER